MEQPVQTPPADPSAALRAAIEARFFAPLDRPRTRRAGVELELPIYNLAPGEPNDFDSIHAAVADFLARFPFPETALDDDGALYRARDPATGDELSFDCSYNTLELSFGPDENIHAVRRRFHAFLPVLQAALRARGHALTGMGINPRWRANRPEPIPNGRYRMLLHHLKSYAKYGGAPRFHDHPDFGLFSCASQVQLDADETTAVPAINAFDALEPYKAVLFANSPFDLGPGRGGALLCARDALWSRSLHGHNPHNCGLYGLRLRTLADLAAYLETTSVYCAERDGRCLNFRPVPLHDYVRAPRLQADWWDPAAAAHRTCDLVPSPSDVRWLRPFKFVDLTHRGTLEFRSVCAQPLRDAFAPAAFHAGLMENLPALADLLDADTVLYGHGYGTAELRAMLVRRDWPAFVDPAALRARLHRILDLAEDGLSRRGHGEAPLLAPLRRRADLLSNPALDHLARLETDTPLASIAAEYAALC